MALDKCIEHFEAQGLHTAHLEPQRIPTYHPINTSGTHVSLVDTVLVSPRAPIMPREGFYDEDQLNAFVEDASRDLSTGSFHPWQQYEAWNSDTGTRLPINLFKRTIGRLESSTQYHVRGEYAPLKAMETRHTAPIHHVLAIRYFPNVMEMGRFEFGYRYVFNDHGQDHPLSPEDMPAWYVQKKLEDITFLGITVKKAPGHY